MSELNVRVKEIRKALKLSQAKFAEKMRVSDGFIGNIETGTNSVSEQVLGNICYRFGVNEEWFRTGRGEMFNASFLNTQASQIFGRLNPQAQEYASKMLLGLLELQNDKEETSKTDICCDTKENE